MFGSLDGWMDRSVGGCLEHWMFGWIAGWVDVWISRWLDG